MEETDRKAFDPVVSRLMRRFPEASEAEIRQQVDRAYQGHAGSRVRHFLPILVEREVIEIRSRVSGPAVRPIRDTVSTRPADAGVQEDEVPLPRTAS